MADTAADQFWFQLTGCNPLGSLTAKSRQFLLTPSLLVSIHCRFDGNSVPPIVRCRMHAKSAGSGLLQCNVYCVYGYTCNICNMVGRPKNKLNALLWDRLQARRAKDNMSARQLARAIGVHPSALSRARGGVMSADFADKVNAFLAISQPPASTDEATMSRSEALQILQELVTLLPDVGRALNVVLDPSGSSE